MTVTNVKLMLFSVKLAIPKQKHTFSLFSYFKMSSSSDLSDRDSNEEMSEGSEAGEGPNEDIYTGNEVNFN